MNTRRFLQNAVWAWPQIGNPLTEARDRYTVTGAPRVVESPWGLALSLDGANDYVTLKDSEEFLLRFDSGSQDFSFVAWVRRGTTGAESVFEKRDAGTDGWLVGFSGGDAIVWRINSSFDVGDTAVVDGLWHCIAVTIDRDGNSAIYLDGVADGGVTAIGGAVMATTILPRIGEISYATGSKFTGDIAGIVIWDRVLSAAEVLALATPGRSF